MNWPVPTPRAALALAVAAAAALAACQRNSDAAAGSSPAASGAAAAASGPAIGVSTVPARQTDMAVTLSATGAVTPLSSVEVRPQLTSVIEKVHIREGQFVKAGDLLFTLDARTNEAMVAQAQAQVAKDQATLADAQRQLVRSRELLAQNFISQGQVDANQAAVDSAAALVQADRAALAAARVSLSYARVTAPSAGRVGTINVYPGTAVQANTTPLLTITQLDPIAVAFSLPQRHLTDALAALPGGGAPVEANLPDDNAARQGRLKFVDNQVDAASGTVKVKAVFDNNDAKLWPGAFVTVNMTARTLRGAVVVPQASIIQGPRGDIVYVVQNGQAAARPVQVAYSQGEDAVVSGVKPGERVVLEGRQNLRPGATVVERGHDAGSAVAASGAQRKASSP
jgi:RND family efflux transporter MFP subunit